MAIAASQKYMDEVAAANPCRATVMFYDQAIAALNDAISAIGADNIEARCRAISKATEIITTLHLNLDIKRGGEIADNLGNLYSFILGRLLRVNLYNDAGIAAQVIEFLEPLRCSWAELADAPIAASLTEQDPIDLTINGASLNQAASPK